MAPFERYGAAHTAVLVATAAAAVLLAVLVRRSSDRGLRSSVRTGLVMLLLGSSGLFVVRAAREGALSGWDVAPLQLCDLAIFVAAYALLTLAPWACEIIYFWGCSGTLIAMISPDLAAPFPSWELVFFFLLHCSVVVSAIVLPFGFGVRPRKRAVFRVFAITNLYALVVGIIDALTGANFLYLRAKPAAGSVLDWMGPWPIYIAAGEALAIVLFLALDAPFRGDGLETTR